MWLWLRGQETSQSYLHTSHSWGGKTIPTIPTLEKIARVLEIEIIDLIKNPSDEENINISILEKIKLIDSLDEEEKEALFKIIDMAIAKKKLKDNLTNLMKD